MVAGLRTTITALLMGQAESIWVENDRGCVLAAVYRQLENLA